jgi:hypothetical protein
LSVVSRGDQRIEATARERHRKTRDGLSGKDRRFAGRNERTKRNDVKTIIEVKRVEFPFSLTNVDVFVCLLWYYIFSS